MCHPSVNVSGTNRWGWDSTEGLTGAILPNFSGKPYLCHPVEGASENKIQLGTMGTTDAFLRVAFTIGKVQHVNKESPFSM